MINVLFFHSLFIFSLKIESVLASNYYLYDMKKLISMGPNVYVAKQSFFL